MLELTSQILGANPDIATLWNCRREVLQRLETEKCVKVQRPRKNFLPPALSRFGGGGEQMRQSWGQPGVKCKKLGGVLENPDPLFSLNTGLLRSWLLW